MHRRLLIALLATLPAARVPAQEEEVRTRPRHKISAGVLHAALSARFPVRLDFGGLLALEITAPRLLLLPARDKLGATLLLQLRNRQARQVHAGEADVAFALRYVAADRTIRAHALEVLDVRSAGLRPQAADLLRALLPQLAREAVGEVVLRRLTDEDLGVAGTMGFEPDRLTVLHDGLLVEFGPKRGP